MMLMLYCSPSSVAGHIVTTLHRGMLKDCVCVLKGVWMGSDVDVSVFDVKDSFGCLFLLC